MTALLQRVSVHIAAVDSPDFDAAALIPIFHRWIRERRLANRLLIDVADYRHVHDGPGVVVVGHDCVFGVGHGGGSLGFDYARRRDEPGAARGKLTEAFRDALSLAASLEEEAGLGLAFDSSVLAVQVKSRLVCPPGPESYAALEPEIRGFCEELFEGRPVAIAHADDRTAPFGVAVRVSGVSEPCSVVARRLGGPRHLAIASS